MIAISRQLSNQPGVWMGFHFFTICLPKIISFFKRYFPATNKLDFHNYHFNILPDLSDNRNAWIGLAIVDEWMVQYTRIKTEIYAIPFISMHTWSTTKTYSSKRFAKFFSGKRLVQCLQHSYTWKSKNHPIYWNNNQKHSSLLSISDIQFGHSCNARRAS